MNDIEEEWVMKRSYEGIGQWAATFACTEVSEGEMGKISENGPVTDAPYIREDTVVLMGVKG